MVASGYRIRREPRAQRSMVWLAAVVSAACCGAARADEVDLSFGLASSTVLRGIALSDLTLRSAASYSTAGGWLAGLGVAALQSRTRHDRWDSQLSPRVGFTRILDADWAWQSAYAHYAYPGSEQLRRYAHHELATTLAYRDLLYLSLAGLRDAHASFGERRTSLAYEIVVSHPFSSGLSPTAGIGYRDTLRASADHAYGHGGISFRRGGGQADLLYVWTNDAAKRYFGSAAANRWVANLTWRF